MVQVHLWSSLRRFADDRESVEVAGATVGEVLANLVAAHPGLAPAIKAGASLSVDGEFLGAAQHQPVPDGAEVFLLQRIRGG